MAKKQASAPILFIKKKKKKGKAAKTKESSNKGSKNYKKPYVGQGR
jgi:hypothetical protein